MQTNSLIFGEDNESNHPGRGAGHTFAGRNRGKTETHGRNWRPTPPVAYLGNLRQLHVEKSSMRDLGVYNYY